MLPNPHHVYLHDTPQKGYFNETSRTFSHGCVRVQNPFELAAIALDDPDWTMPALLSAAANGKTRTIVLRQPLPVLILYWTAAASGDGRVQFLPDVYERDPPVIRGLGAKFTFRRIGMTNTRSKDGLKATSAPRSNRFRGAFRRAAPSPPSSGLDAM